MAILELYARYEELAKIYLARPSFNGRLQLGQPGIFFAHAGLAGFQLSAWQYISHLSARSMESSLELQHKTRILFELR